jgi:putative DNA primase/helicase
MSTRTSTSSRPREQRQRVDFPPLSRRPIFLCYDKDFVVKEQPYKAGVYFHDIKPADGKNGNEGDVLIDQWICSVLKVISVVRSNTGSEHSYLIEYIPHGDSSPRRSLMSQALLLGRPEEPLKALRDLGVSVLFANLKSVREYLDHQHLRFSVSDPDDFWRSAKVIGWSPAPDCFVLPNETLGDHSRVWFSGKCEGNIYAKSGDLKEWKTNVAALCKNNPFLAFAVSSAFAGPLLELLNIPGIGFHLHGDSTSGKTTVLAAAASVWGPASFVLAWRSTVNGLESQAATRSSTLVALDESHMIDAKALDAGIYLLANGVSKNRMTRDISTREVARWRVCVLSSGERSIEAHLGAARIDHKVGQGMRIADVPVGGNFGLFDDLHGRKNGGAFSDELRGAAAKYYGHPGPLFVQQIIDNGIPSPDILSEITARLGDNLSAQEQRVARAFTLVAWAGELANAWGIVPWQEGDALAAATEIFDRWRDAQPSSPKGKEFAQVINGVREFIEVHGADFSDSDWMPEHDQYTSRIVNTEPVIRERAGYWKEDGTKRVYLFNAAGLKRASSGFGVRKAIEVLTEAGAIIDHDPGKSAKKCWIRHLKRSLSFYVIDPDKLE